MSRELWQADRLANSFPDGGGPVLPPFLIGDEYAAALPEQYARRDSRISPTEACDQLPALLSQLHQKVRQGMEIGISEGYVPEYALDRLEPAFTQTGIDVADSRLTDKELAEYDHNLDLVTLSTAIFPNAEKYLAHEIAGHKVSGGTFVILAGGTVARIRRGFVNHNENAANASAWHYGLDEAVQHHLALSYFNGEFGIMDPRKRANHDPRYFEHRELLAEFILRSCGVVSLRPITLGSFEDSTPDGALTTNRRIMVAQGRTAYGPGSYRKLSLLFDALDIKPYGVDVEDLAERIHSPQLHPDGTIKSPGHIDLDRLPRLTHHSDEPDAEDY